MAHAQVCTAAEAWLAAHWTHSEVPILAPNGDGGVPADGAAFLKIDYPWCRSAQKSIGAPGNNVHREEGVFRVLIFVPRGIGVDDGRAWSAEIEAMFRGQSLAEHLVCYSPSTATDDQDTDGAYCVFAVAVEYRFDLFG